MSDDSPKVINAFTRKAFVAPDPTEASKPKVDKTSLALCEDILERIKTGDLTHLVIAGLHQNNPICALVSRMDTSIEQLAMVNLAVDSVKMKIREEIDGYRDRLAEIEEEESVDDDPEDPGA
jgi:hypothetical protein